MRSACRARADRSFICSVSKPSWSITRTFSSKQKIRDLDLERDRAGIALFTQCRVGLEIIVDTAFDAFRAAFTACTTAATSLEGAQTATDRGAGRDSGPGSLVVATRIIASVVLLGRIAAGLLRLRLVAHLLRGCRKTVSDNSTSFGRCRLRKYPEPSPGCCPYWPGDGLWRKFQRWPMRSILGLTYNSLLPMPRAEVALDTERTAGQLRHTADWAEGHIGELAGSSSVAWYLTGGRLAQRRGACRARVKIPTLDLAL